jgi:hypothetical protein
MHSNIGVGRICTLSRCVYASSDGKGRAPGAGEGVGVGVYASSDGKGRAQGAGEGIAIGGLGRGAFTQYASMGVIPSIGANPRLAASSEGWGAGEGTGRGSGLGHGRGDGAGHGRNVGWGGGESIGIGGWIAGWGGGRGEGAGQAEEHDSGGVLW